MAAWYLLRVAHAVVVHRNSSVQRFVQNPVFDWVFVYDLAFDLSLLASLQEHC